MALKGGKRFKILYVANNKYENREFQSLQGATLPNFWFGMGNAYSVGNGYGRGSLQVQKGDSPNFVFDKTKFSNFYPNLFKDNHNDVTPYNFNINLLVKI